MISVSYNSRCSCIDYIEEYLTRNGIFFISKVSYNNLLQQEKSFLIFEKHVKQLSIHMSLLDRECDECNECNRTLIFKYRKYLNDD